MMEKMGWTDGQGLGISNQGQVEPVTLKAKNDAKGVGFKGNAESKLAHQVKFQTWSLTPMSQNLDSSEYMSRLMHNSFVFYLQQDDFESLLENLNASHGNSAANSGATYSASEDERTANTDEVDNKTKRNRHR